MQCPRCQHENRPQANSCEECGSPFRGASPVAGSHIELKTEVESLRRALSEALEQQTATSELLKVIGRSTFDLQPVFETLAENGVRLCGAKQASVFRFDGQVLRIVATHNASPEARAFLEQHPIAPGRQSGSARAALERRTIHIHDAQSDPEYTYGVVQVHPLRTVLATPMLRAGELLGVIFIYREEVRPFSHREIALLETFADQAAIAIAIPIVIAVSNDPVQAGLVASLARPGGNLTGLTFLLSDLAAKRLEMLHEAAPKASRVGILWNPDHADPDFKETQAAAPTLGVRIVSLEVRRPGDFDTAFQKVLREHADALIVVSSRLMTRERQRILEFAAKHRLPLSTGWGAWAANGALFSYGPNIDEIVRRSAVYVDKILKGTKPADLPVQQPTQFELVINLKTAKALG